MQVNFQDYKVYPIRASGILTGAYVAGTVIGPVTTQAPGNLEPTKIPGAIVNDKNQLVLLIQLALGNLTSAKLKVEFSPDNVTYFQETYGSITGGTETDSLGEHLLSTSGNFRIPVQVKDGFIKVSAIANSADPTNSLMQIDAVVGTA